MKHRIALLCGFSMVAAAVLSGQMMTQSSLSGTSGSGSGGGFRGGASFGVPPGFARQVITGAAYSGEEVSERVQTLADGTHITQTNTQRKVYRDSEGRTRTERPLMMGPAMTNSKVESPIVIEITDPVAGFQYVLDTQNKVAHRQVLPRLDQTGPNSVMKEARMGAPAGGVLGGIIGSVPSMAPPPPPGGTAVAQITASQPSGIVRSGDFTATLPAPGGSNSGPMRPKFSNESLGTQTIDGVLVEGRRTTTTYPVGMMGNDREFSTTNETWTSPDLKILVLSKSNDPRSGENTFRIANLSRTPPDATLFMAPSDYTIVDEKGGFTINYGQQ